jgi:hypothetical protein
MVLGFSYSLEVLSSGRWQMKSGIGAVRVVEKDLRKIEVEEAGLRDRENVNIVHISEEKDTIIIIVVYPTSCNVNRFDRQTRLDHSRFLGIYRAELCR